MPLPKKITKISQDTSFLKTHRPVKSQIDFSLPSPTDEDSSITEFDNTDFDFGEISDSPAPKVASHSTRKNERKNSSSVHEPEDEWNVDPKTGKKYKKLGAVDPLLVKQHKRGVELSISTLIREAEKTDFDIDNLDGMANDFLAHLRVPPDKDEQKRLAEERKKQQSMQNQEYTQEASQLADKFDKDLEKPFDFNA